MAKTATVAKVTNEQTPQEIWRELYQLAKINRWLCIGSPDSTSKEWQAFIERVDRLVKNHREFLSQDETRGVPACLATDKKETILSGLLAERAWAAQERDRAKEKEEFAEFVSWRAAKKTGAHRESAATG
jgi:hypothetical protein